MEHQYKMTLLKAFSICLHRKQKGGKPVVKLRELPDPDGTFSYMQWAMAAKYFHASNGGKDGIYYYPSQITENMTLVEFLEHINHKH